MGGNAGQNQLSHLSFQYQATNKDLSAHLGPGKGFTRLSPFFAMAPGVYFVHGNSEISILDGARLNIASQYDTLRQIRSWSLSPAIGYTAFGPVYKWAIDTQGNGPSWKDVPGHKFTNGPPEWQDQRDMLEFFVTVDEHPEIGSLYFFVIVSLKPGQYRVEMSSGLYSAYKGDSSPLANTSQPWAKESGCTIDVDSGWRKATQ